MSRPARSPSASGDSVYAGKIAFGGVERNYAAAGDEQQLLKRRRGAAAPGAQHSRSASSRAEYRLDRKRPSGASVIAMKRKASTACLPPVRNVQSPVAPVSRRDGPLCIPQSQRSPSALISNDHRTRHGRRRHRPAQRNELLEITVAGTQCGEARMKSRVVMVTDWRIRPQATSVMMTPTRARCSAC
jgi:hypothetical protein